MKVMEQVIVAALLLFLCLQVAKVAAEAQGKTWGACNYRSF
jgi:hypothetical protein